MLTIHRAEDPVWGKATATFDATETYRYALSRIWDPDLPMTAFVMLNPSTASAFVLDPTVRRCLGYAREWGSGGLLVLNAFALRSTDPKALYGHSNPVGEKNDDLIMQSLRWTQPAQVVAGWGAHAGKLSRHGERKARGTTMASALWRSRQQEMVTLLGDRLMALAVTKDGNPGHPLYLPGDALPFAWNPSSKGTVRA